MTRSGWSATPAKTAGACLAVALTVTTACSPEPTPNPRLQVFAAASLTESMETLTTRFAGEADVIVAGSHQLVAQILDGADADVFASADFDQMNRLIEAGRVQRDRVQRFAGNALVVVVPRDNEAAVRDLGGLAQPGLKLVLGHSESPIGSYSDMLIAKTQASGLFGERFEEGLERNIASREPDVRAVLAKVSLGEADAGIVYRTDITADVRPRVQAIEVPVRVSPEIGYWIAPLEDSSKADAAAAFVDFVLSPLGQEILDQRGLLPIQ